MGRARVDGSAPMRSWGAERIARAAGARLVSPDRAGTGPDRVVIDSREAGPGALFVGLRGRHVDGGEFAGRALSAGAWGVLATPGHIDTAPKAGRTVLLAAADPLVALQRLATAWRRELGAKVIGVTGSTGKTSTKDLLLAVLSPQRRTVASRANLNTEIGLPLEIVNADEDAEVLVLEMAMRGSGQIAELARVAEPDVGVIVSVGPVHLELLGTVEAVAAAKAELIDALPPGATVVVPAGEPLLAPYLHRRHDIGLLTFGNGGDVQLRRADRDRVEIDLGGELSTLEVPFTQQHLRLDLLAAVAAAKAIGVTATGRIELALSPGRGQRIELADEAMLIDDCYNANPMSMRAALEDLVDSGRREQHRRCVAVLGDMLELGPEELAFHLELGEQASRLGVELLVTVGPLAAAIAERFDGEAHCVADAGEAAALVPELLEPGDLVLVKASRGVGLELVCRAICSTAQPLAGPSS